MINKLSNYKKIIDLVKFMKQKHYRLVEANHSTKQIPVLERENGKKKLIPFKKTIKTNLSTINSKVL